MLELGYGSTRLVSGLPAKHNSSAMTMMHGPISIRPYFGVHFAGGEVSKVALFYPSVDHMDFECPDCRPLLWQGGQVPIDKPVCKLRVVTIEPAAFLSITCLAIIGITLAFAFLAFNLHFRKLK